MIKQFRERPLNIIILPLIAIFMWIFISSLFSGYETRLRMAEYSGIVKGVDSMKHENMKWHTIYGLPASPRP